MALQFNDIVDVKKWQRIQDHFAEVLRVPLRTVDTRGILLTSISCPPRLCEEIMRTSMSGVMECAHYMSLFYEGLDTMSWEEGYRCPIDLYKFPIPLKIRDRTMAYLVVGPVILGKRRDLDHYRGIAQKYGLDSEQFLDAVRDISIFSYYGIKSVNDLLYDIGLSVCELGYQNMKLKSLLPKKPEALERVHDFYEEKLLNALLEVSYSFTDADRGSIMLLDEEKKELYIKMARGLSQEIMQQARLKVGEGLAGIVAQERKPLFLHDHVKDEKIRSRLHNPQLKYSILIPIALKEKVLGVLNVATSKVTSDKFTSQNLKTIDMLTQLVETTLGDMPERSLP